MLFTIRKLLLVLCTCNACLAFLGAVDTLQPPPIDIDKFVTPWSEFGIRQYKFLGTWGNNTFQANVWLRLIPTSSSNERAVRVVSQLSHAPTMMRDTTGWHVTTPFDFLRDGKLPAITFTAVDHTGAPEDVVVVHQSYWEEHFREQNWRAGTFYGMAVLKADTTYTMAMEGSELLNQIPAFRSSKPHSMFQDKDVWLGMVEVLGVKPGPFQFLLLEHLRYHLRLGFKGTMLVVVAETAALLLANPGILDAVTKKQLVLVLWDLGYERGSRFIMQRPGNNLMKLAMVGSNTTLGLWDLDEFLVLPHHRNISFEVHNGCLAQLHDPANLEAVVSFTLTVTQDVSTVPDIVRWHEHGSFEAAIKGMPYTMLPYKNCNKAGYCKALINPNSNYSMHVHQLVRPPHESFDRTPTDRGCAYFHHFWNLWGRRGWKEGSWLFDMLSEEEPLALEDMPFSS